MDDETNNYELVMPFVVCDDQGGPYDTTAFVAGVRFGQDMDELKNKRPERWETHILINMVPQYDLLAMRYGYEMSSEPWDEHPDDWVLVIFRKVDSQKIQPL